MLEYVVGCELYRTARCYNTCETISFVYIQRRGWVGGWVGGGTRLAALFEQVLTKALAAKVYP